MSAPSVVCKRIESVIDSTESMETQSIDVTYKFGIKVPILLNRLRRTFVKKIVYSSRSAQDTSCGHHSYPDVQEARCEVVAVRAQRAPTFAVTA